tara:strand:+ start:272 stop:1690 length:1419 start_codon:yes stop_codon:yes gene_type:complete
MATEILVRVYIDGTGDYTSLRAAVIAEATNLVTADSYMVFELKGDLRNTDAFVDFNSYTTDATRNVIIRPIDSDRTDGITGNTGTIYGVSTFAIVSRNKFITIDGLDFDGWSSDFFEPANTKITNSLLSNGGVRILNVASLDNTIIYDVPNQTINSIAGDVTRVTIVNKLSFYPASDFLFRSIAGAVTFCVAYNEKSGSLNYSISTNGANDFNASNDTSAPGTNSQTVATSDFTDYANNNFNIDPASPLFALGVGADLVPASGGTTVTINPVNQSQTIDQVTLTEHSVISIGGLSQAQTVEQVALQQSGTLSLNNLDQIQTIDQVNLTQAHIVSVNDLSQLQTIDQVSLNQGNVLAVNDTDQLQTVDQVTLSTAGTVAINNASQAQTLEQLVLSIAGTVAINNLLQSQLLEQLNLTQAHVVSVDNLSQAQLLQSINFNGVVVGYLQGALTIVSAYNGQIKLTNPLTGEIRIL